MIFYCHKTLPGGVKKITLSPLHFETVEWQQVRASLTTLLSNADQKQKNLVLQWG